ncbi:hypothetical protein D3C80_2150100 [compost metagenome]
MDTRLHSLRHITLLLKLMEYFVYAIPNRDLVIFLHALNKTIAEGAVQNDVIQR